MLLDLLSRFGARGFLTSRTLSQLFGISPLHYDLDAEEISLGVSVGVLHNGLGSQSFLSEFVETNKFCRFSVERKEKQNEKQGKSKRGLTKQNLKTYKICWFLQIRGPEPDREPEPSRPLPFR